MEPKESRQRVELRVEAEWHERVRRQAERLGLSISAYIRLATSERLEKDEETEKKA